MRGFQPDERGDDAAVKRKGPRGFSPEAVNSAEAAQAQNQAPDSIPAMVKPGEFVLPPDTVHAMGGPGAVQDVVDATHTPAPEAAIVPRGFEPRMFFANGGSAGDERLRANSFGDAAAAATDAGVKQVGATSTPAQTSSPSGLYMQDRTQEIKDQVGQGQYAQAAGTAARTAVQGLGMYGIEAADKLATPVLNAAKGFSAGLFGSDASASPVPATPTSSAAAASKPVTGAPTAAQTSAAPLNAIPAVPAPMTTDAPVTAGFRPGMGGDVKKDGNSYSGTNVSGNITVNGVAPSAGSSGVSGQSDAAAENLARGFRPGMGTASPAPAPGLGFGPGSELARIQTPVVRHSGNDWQARKDLENAATAASSIMYRPGWDGSGMARFRGGAPGGVAPAVAAYQAALATDQAAKGAQPGMDQAAMRENAGLQREGMQQAGETVRTGMRTGVDQQRVAIEGQRAGTESRRADSEITARGFQNRALQQQEQLRGVLMDPNATPEQKKQAQQSMLAIQGKHDSAKDRYLTVGGETRVVDGQTVKDPQQVYDTVTQQWLKPPGQGGAQPSANHINALKSNPTQAALFDAVYGPGASKRYLE